MKRRTFVGGVAASSVIGVSGCLGGVADAASFEAAVPSVVDSTLEETGYAVKSTEEIGVEREFEVAGQSETVAVTNQLREYSKAIDFGVLGEQEMGVFGVFATPKVEVLGQTFNPIAEMSSKELINLIAENYDNMGDIEARSESTVTILGESTTDARYTSQATVEEQSVELVLHVTEAVERGNDLLVTIAGYPEAIKDQEQPNVVELMENVLPASESPTTINSTNDSQ